MDHLEIRKKFLNFFEEKGHKIVPSSSLLPNDSSVLFTTAGMQQFKPYYLEEESPYGNRTTSIQKSMRTSDIEEVGDESHNTFFEMLGNFSFKNDYFRKEAIKFAHEFIFDTLKISPDRVTISIFKGDPNANLPADEESLKIWKDLGIREDKIFFQGREDNFWGPTGDQGPCGPTTEVYIDDVEIWNIVFNEFYCEKNHKGEDHILPLTRKGIDTGMGMERLAMVLQNVPSIFETDLFIPVIEEIRGKENLYDYKKNSRSERIIADHLKSSIFLISEGVLPSNSEQGFILRRLLRSAIRHVKLLNLPDDVYKRVTKVVANNIYGDVYPELSKKEKEILKVILLEKDKFTKTLDIGLKELGKVIERLIKKGEKTISGSEAFKLHSSYGFPIELIEELAVEREINIDRVGFEKETREHKEKSRAGAGKKFGGHGLILDTGELKAADEEELKKVTRLHTATHLLHAALRKLFGDEIRQMGSDITVERLRFDFTFPQRMTVEEKQMTEEEINNVVKLDLKVTMQEMSHAEAMKSGALHFFKEKYPDRVKVYSIGDYSKELCGGPHVTHTGEIGEFKILKEEAVSAGVRRIRATVE